MEILEYQVVMERIQEIEQEQLARLYYICRYLEDNFDFNKEAAREKMLQLQEEKQKLFDYIEKEGYLPSSYIL